MTVSTGSRAGQVATECTPPPRTSRSPQGAGGYTWGKDDYLTRLRKIEGQVRGLQRMIDAGTWCPDVVTQVAPVTRALHEVPAGLLNDHIRHCAAAATRASASDGEQAIAEVTSIIRG
jgi:CsoR family transcriptional regulator, copper-sensing transcriptional repressor